MTDEELEQLLPWYVNGTLDEEESAAVEALLERSDSARQEVAFLRALSEQLSREPVPAPSELGWQRLRKQLHTVDPRPAQHWWKPGIAAAAIVIMTLQVMIVTREPQPYDARMLGDAPSQVLENSWLIQIRFDQNRPWAELTAIVRELNGTIVGGPSGIGLLRISVPRERSGFASGDELLSWLQRQDGVTHAAIEGN